MQTEFQRFVPFTKVIPHKQEVTGVLTQGIVDFDGEVLDYTSSVPYFMAWSQMVHEDSSGKSLGNIRVMHAPVVAGKVIDLQFDHRAQKIIITSKITNKAAWNDVMEGVLTGYSVGGTYVDKWDDPRVLTSGKNAVRYTADPHEASLVDRPSVPTAIFSSMKAMVKVVRSDGTEEDVPMTELKQVVEQDEANEGVAGEGVTVTKVQGVDEAEADAELAAAALEAVSKRIRRRSDVSAADRRRAVAEYGNVEYADPTNKKYPIDTEKHIRAAWSYIYQAKDIKEYSTQELFGIRAKIIAAWKRKIDAQGPPSATTGGNKGVATDRVVAEPSPLSKGLWRAASILEVLQQLASFVTMGVQEDAAEANNTPGSKPSKVPAQVGVVLRRLAPMLVQYLEEEVQELLAEVDVSIQAEASKMIDKTVSVEAQATTGAEGKEKLSEVLATLQEVKKAFADATVPPAKHSDETKVKDPDGEPAAADVIKRRELVKDASVKAGANETIEGLLKTLGELAVTTAADIKALKGVLIMQAGEIRRVQDSQVRSAAPLAALQDDRFPEAYLKALRKEGAAGAKTTFGSMLKEVYAARGGVN